jgi:hypothetical protein
MDRYPTQERIDWIMDTQASGKATDPAQIMLVVAGSAYVRDVEAAFDGISAGNLQAMKKVYEDILEQLKDLVKQTHKNLDRSSRQRVMTQITMVRRGVTVPSSLFVVCRRRTLSLTVMLCVCLCHRRTRTRAMSC